MVFVSTIWFNMEHLWINVFRLFWMYQGTGKQYQQSWIARFNIVGGPRGPAEVCQVSSYLKDLRVSPPTTTHAHIKCGDNSVKFGTSPSPHCIKTLPLTVSCTVYSRFNQPTIMSPSIVSFIFELPLGKILTLRVIYTLWVCK